MNKHALLCALLLAGWSSSANAELVLGETFFYPDGDLVDAAGSPWSDHSGTGPAAVLDGRLVLTSGAGQDVHSTLIGAPYDVEGPVEALYAAMTVRFTELPNSTGAYFAHFNHGSGSFRARIWASTSNAINENTFRLGIGNSTASDASSGQIATDLSLDTDYTVVIRHRLATGDGTIWLNPTAETDPGVTATDETNKGGVPISSFAFRQNAGMGTVLIDNLRVGTTFADVAGPDLPPTLSPLADQSTSADTVIGPLAFAMGDDHTPPDELTVSAVSDNQTLIPDANILLSGSGATREITLTPAVGQQGVANIEVSVDDGTATTTTTFRIVIGTPSIAHIADQETPRNTPLGPIELLVADAEEGADALIVTAVSDNQSVIADDGLAPGGSGANRTLTIHPVPDVGGLATITVTVDDGERTASSSFRVTVFGSLGQVVADNFDREDGPLTGTGGWISHSGTEQEAEISDGRLALSSVLSEDVSIALNDGVALPSSDGYIFHASFVVNFSELPSNNGTYFAHFKEGGLSFKGRVIAKTEGAAEGSFRLGVTSAANTATADSTHPLDLALGTDYLVVLRLNAATGESRLWIDPVAPHSTHVDSTDPPSPANVASFAFRQNTGMGALTVDDVKIGSAFHEVVQVSGLPEITATRQGATLVLSWPGGDGFTLRQTATLPATDAIPVDVVVDGGNESAEIDTANGNAFFYLQKD